MPDTPDKGVAGRHRGPPGVALDLRAALAAALGRRQLRARVTKKTRNKPGKASASVNSVLRRWPKGTALQNACRGPVRSRQAGSRASHLGIAALVPSCCTSGNAVVPDYLWAIRGRFGRLTRVAHRGGRSVRRMRRPTASVDNSALHDGAGRRYGTRLAGATSVLCLRVNSMRARQPLRARSGQACDRWRPASLVPLR